MPTYLLFDLTLIGLLLLASAFDLHQRKIPNRLVGLGLLAALGLHLWTGQVSDLLTVYLAGFAVGLLMFLPLYLVRGMAAGDVKLMATVGAFLGPSLALQSSLATYCAGGVLALGIVLVRGRGRVALANVGAMLHPLLLRTQGVRLQTGSAIASVGGMPYAVAITAGTCAVLCLRHT